MPLSATISTEKTEIHLPDTVLVNYYFTSDTSGLAKTYKKYAKLHIEISVPMLLSSVTALLERNEEILEELRNWGSLQFGTLDCEFYRSISLTHTWGEEVFREIKLSDGYIENFSETIDFVKRKHVIRLELRQKEDKLELIQGE